MMDAMVVTSCPVTTIRAPIHLLWEMLSQPSSYETWVDAELVAVEPPGPAAPGQVMRMRTRAMGRWWSVQFDVLDVVDSEHRIAVDVTLPLGIVNHEVIMCRAVSPEETQVGFN